MSRLASIKGAEAVTEGTASRRYLTLIDGEMVESSSGNWLTSIDPATEEVLGQVPACNPADVDRAVAAAARAQPAWADVSIAERAALLREVGRQLMAQRDVIVDIEVRDSGNTISRMAHDLTLGVDMIDYYAGIANEVKGETLPGSRRGLHMVLRDPYGVVGRIVPFNHPIYFGITAIAGPLMAGNAVLLKPSEQSPLSASYLGEVCAKVLPRGLVNILSGSGEVGAAIVRHPGVPRIAFTGSVPTGLAIQRTAAESCVKHVSLELGGKNPIIVFPDMDVEAAADAAVAGMNFAWQGQSCGSTSRLMVHESIYDAVVDAVADRVKRLHPGDPRDPSAQVGPINSRGHFERVCSYVRMGIEDGARLVAGGKRPTGPQFERGFWIEPTVFADVTMDMRIAREEIFGPVLSILRWRDAEDAVAVANATQFGLTASIWTQDVGAALAMARRVRAGTVAVNCNILHYPGSPFGGVGNSGTGREECLDELLSYTQTKAIHVAL